MIAYGVDFTSAPSRRKPITVAKGTVDGTRLTVESLLTLNDLDQFEIFLNMPGPWVAALDFPFGQPRRFVEAMGWSTTWEGYVRQVGGMTRDEFVAALMDYKRPRVTGDKEHRRITDVLAGSISPMKLYNPPVGKMFFEGAPRLLRGPATILPMRPRDDDGGRVIVEGYPGALARRLLARQSYKNDRRVLQTPERRAAREALLTALLSSDFTLDHGITVTLSENSALECLDDGSGDRLDAVLCAAQAAWAYRRRDTGYGIPADADRLEGWIIGMEPGRGS